MGNKRSGDRRLYLCFEMDTDGHGVMETVTMSPTIKDLAPWLKTNEQTYLIKKLRSNRDKFVRYKDHWWSKKKF